MIKASPSLTPDFVRISDGDLTEIELHSVDSINDLHVDRNDKGSIQLHPQGLSTNGTLQEMPVLYQTAYPTRSQWRGRIFRVCTAAASPYSCGCAAVTLILLTLGLIFCFLVQQGSALHALSQAMRERQELALEISQLIEELRRNLTAISEKRAR